MQPMFRGHLFVRAQLFRNQSCLRLQHRQVASMSPPPPPNSQTPRSRPDALKPRTRAAAEVDTKKNATANKATEASVEETNSLLTPLKRLLMSKLPRPLRDSPQLRSYLWWFIMVLPIIAWSGSHFPFHITSVTGPSMRPTINPDCTAVNDQNYSPAQVISQKRHINLLRDWYRRGAATGTAATLFTRGDIVLLTSPHDPETLQCKRIVAVAGDTVIPLKGYPGGENLVVIPYNHVWVEGDVNDRKLSLDSNYYGPIPTGLIVGKALATWSPWWKLSTWRVLDRTRENWPARAQNRVVENAVQDESIHPDKKVLIGQYEGEMGEKMLRMLEERPLDIEEQFFTNEGYRAQVAKFYAYAVMSARSHQNPATRARSKVFVTELEKMFGRNVLQDAASGTKSKQRVKGDARTAAEDALEYDAYFSSSRAVTHEDERNAEREARISPAKIALNQMLEQKKQFGEMKDKEFEARDRLREERGL